MTGPGSSSRNTGWSRDSSGEDVTATYRDGILTVSVGFKPEKKESVKKIEVKAVK